MLKIEAPVRKGGGAQLLGGANLRRQLTGAAVLPTQVSVSVSTGESTSPQVVNLRPGGHIEPDELFHSARRAFQ